MSKHSELVTNLLAPSQSHYSAILSETGFSSQRSH